MRTTRRRFLSELGVAAAGLGLAPLASMLGACSRTGLPEGMVEIKWDRDICVRCSMAISDRRFAAQVHGGPKKQTWKFDDIGCVAFWLKTRPWGEDAATKIWVSDSAAGDGTAWLDARQARYIGGKASPMGYNFAAAHDAPPGSPDFETMRRQVLARGR